jgi:drug/metabolite transporter (DMT)-like permease
MQCEEKTLTTEQVATPERRPIEIGVILAYIACILIWGTTWFAIRVCIGQEGYPPFLAGGMRFAIAGTLGVGLILMFLHGRHFLPQKHRGSVKPLPLYPDTTTTGHWSWLTLASVLGTFGAGMVYTAEHWVSGAVCSIVNSTTPLVMALIATLTGAERVSRSSVIGSMIGFLGIAIVFHERLNVSVGEAIGIGLMLGSVILAATNNLIVKKYLTGFHPIMCVVVFNLVSCVMFLGWSVGPAKEPVLTAPPLVPTMAVVYLAVFGSMLAFGLYFYLIKRISLMAISALVLFPPVIALVVDSIWEKDCTLSMSSYVGIAVTLAGLAISLFAPKETAR